MKRRAKFRARLLPVVMVAAAGLLLLKLIGLWSQGGYLFIDPSPKASGHARFGHAITDVRRDPDYARDDITGATPAKKDEKKDKKDEGEQALPPVPAAAPKPAVPPPLPSAAERVILEKLGERRQQLDERLKEIELREQLLQSAEKMLQERLGELKESESRVASSVQAREQTEQSQMKSLVVMYEAMKPREAARVFERMEARMLATLAQQMNPRKLSEVLAQMTPDAAEKLTAALIRRMPAGAEGDKPPARQSAPASAPAQPPELEALPRPQSSPKS